MKKYEKPEIKEYKVLTETVIAGSLDQYLNDNELYDPKMTTFLYNS